MSWWSRLGVGLVTVAPNRMEPRSPSGSRPGQALTLSPGGDRCKTRWYGQRRDLDDHPGIPCDLASFARVPFVLRTFPPQSGGNPTPTPSGGFAMVSRRGEGILVFSARIRGALEMN